MIIFKYTMMVLKIFQSVIYGFSSASPQSSSCPFAGYVSGIGWIAADCGTRQANEPASYQKPCGLWSSSPHLSSCILRIVERVGSHSSVSSACQLVGLLLSYRCVSFIMP